MVDGRYWHGIWNTGNGMGKCRNLTSIGNVDKHFKLRQRQRLRRVNNALAGYVPAAVNMQSAFARPHGAFEFRPGQAENFDHAQCP
jgi:hypothetical protein